VRAPEEEGSDGIHDGQQEQERDEQVLRARIALVNAVHQDDPDERLANDQPHSAALETSEVCVALIVKVIR